MPDPETWKSLRQRSTPSLHQRSTAATTSAAPPGAFGTSPVCGQSQTAWVHMEGKIETFMAQQRESHKLLIRIAQEQDSFLREMHNLAISQRKAGVEEPEVLWREVVNEQPVAPSPGAELVHEDVVPAERALGLRAVKSDATFDDGLVFQGGDGLANYIVNMDSDRSSKSGGGKMMRASTSRNDIWSCMLTAVEALVVSKYFEPVMGVIILSNAANIGWAIDRELQGKDTSVQEAIEYVFLATFMLELGLRFLVYGRSCLRQWWNLFDVVLISLTLVSMFLRAVIDITNTSGSAFQVMQQLLLLRMLRLLRLARAVRLLTMFRSLWKLVQGLKNSLGAMASAFVLMALAIFFFACFGAEFITKVYKDDPEVGRIVRQHFASMPQIIITLVQFISMDSISAFYVPLVYRSPLLAIYFLLLLILVSIALMNLVTALLVEDAISTTKMDNEMIAQSMRARLRNLRPAFIEFFKRLDASGDGIVQAKEVVAAVRSGMHVPSEIQDLINPARMLDLFDAMDSDRSGDLTEAEFVEGLGCVAVSAVPLETMQILHHLRILRREIGAFRKAMREKLPPAVHI